tara:strand:- start:108 stop:530 length:423 start_codon:yes stop_codon:yes gene_type:complete
MKVSQRKLKQIILEEIKAVLLAERLTNDEIKIQDEVRDGQGLAVIINKIGIKINPLWDKARDRLAKGDKTARKELISLWTNNWHEAFIKYYTAHKAQSLLNNAEIAHIAFPSYLDTAKNIAEIDKALNRAIRESVWGTSA